MSINFNFLDLIYSSFFPILIIEKDKEHLIEIKINLY